MNIKEQCAEAGALLTRRTILKLIAGAPLVATFGFVASPLLRYLKPTMKPGNFFQTADLPKADQSVRFHRIDFPQSWTCLPFMLPITYTVFNPEEHETRKTPGFILATAKNEIVAYSRLCTAPCHVDGHHQLLNFLMNTTEIDCIAQSKSPVLYCPCSCCLSTYDLNDHGRVIGGAAKRPLRRIDVAKEGDYYVVTGPVEPEIV
ncbi:MAG: hypothetical protein WC028_01755 [Candidatus Obscuribacterales bacterium]